MRNTIDLSQAHQSFDTLLANWNAAMEARAHAEAGAFQSPSLSLTSSEQRGHENAVRRAASAVRRHPDYPAYVQRINDEAAHLHGLYADRRAALTEAFTASIQALDALPGHAGPDMKPTARALREAWSDLNCANSFRIRKVEDRQIAELTPFEQALKADVNASLEAA